MSVSIPFSFTAGTKARASEVNQNFQAVAAKFTEGAGGIADADISTTAGIKGSKLSSVAGNRITQAQLEDDAVDLRVLKDDATGGSPNAAVNSANHIKDGIITNAKILAGTLKRGALNISSVSFTVPALAPLASAEVATGLLSTVGFPILLVSEGAGSGFGTSQFTHVRLYLNTSTGAYSVLCANVADSAITAASFGLKLYYLVI